MEKFYTVEEVANILKIHRNTVYEFVRKGELDAVKVAKAYRIPEISLQEFIKRNRVLKPENKKEK